MPLRANRITLAHAILSAMHPSLVTFRSLPLPLPAELHSLICDHLLTLVANDLLRSLQEALISASSALCEDCKVYNVHVFGPRVMDWPCMHTGAQCRCATIGVLATDRCVGDYCDTEENPSFSLPFREKNQELPAYIIKHVRDTLSAYAAIDPRFPYSTHPLTSAADLTSFLSDALEAHNCVIKPLPTTKRGVDNDFVLITCHDDLHKTLARLRLVLRLPSRPDTVPPYLSHLRNITYQPLIPDSYKGMFDLLFGRSNEWIFI